MNIVKEAFISDLNHSLIQLPTAEFLLTQDQTLKRNAFFFFLIKNAIFIWLIGIIKL